MDDYGEDAQAFIEYLASLNTLDAWPPMDPPEWHDDEPDPDEEWEDEDD